MGRHSGISALALTLGLGALASHPVIGPSGNPFAPDAPNYFRPRAPRGRIGGGRPHPAGTKADRRKRNKAARKARILNAHIRSR
jgi:hypothetical protein